MKSEIDSLQENETWDLENIPIGKDARKAMTGRWVYKIKHKADGTTRYKARWVVHGYRQREGIDYDEIYASVVKVVSHRTIIAMTAKSNLHME